MNVRKRRLPVGAVAMLLVLFLATLGIGYGLWAKLLTIDGVVETGNVDGVWFYVVCSEPGDPPEAEGKDVGSVTAEIDPCDQERLFVTIHNGYPSYDANCEVHFANNGSIPIKIRAIRVNNPNPEAVTVSFVDGIGSQLEPCGFTPPFGTFPSQVPTMCQAASSLYMHVEQDALQDHTYRFAVEVCVAQWNEPATSTQCFAAAP